jgi:hypothetical protein
VRTSNRTQHNINCLVLIIFQQNWTKQEVMNYILRFTNLLILLEIRKNCQSSGRNLLFYLFIRRVVKQSVVIIKECLCYQLCNKLLYNILLLKLTTYVDRIIGVHLFGFLHNHLTADHIFCIHQILKKKWQYEGTLHQLFIFLKKAYYLVKKEILCNILIEFGMPFKLVRLSRIWG